MCVSTSIYAQGSISSYVSVVCVYMENHYWDSSKNSPS